MEGSPWFGGGPSILGIEPCSVIIVLLKTAAVNSPTADLLHSPNDTWDLI